VENRRIPDEVIEMLKHLPSTTHPIDAVRTGVSALAPYDPDLEDTSLEANRRKAVRLVAKTGMLYSNADNLLLKQVLELPKATRTATPRPY
jgi:citrate synthase